MAIVPIPLRMAGAVSGLLLGIGVPAVAQDFNPYDAVQAGLTLDQLDPVIEREIGPITDRGYIGENFLDQPSSGPSLLVVVTEPHIGRYPAYFFFCEEVLTAFASPVSQAIAYAIAEQIGAATAEAGEDPPPAAARLADDSIRVELADGKTTVTYYDVDSAEVSIEAAHPVELFRTRDFHGHCVGGQD